MLVRLWRNLSASGGTCPPLADDSAACMVSSAVRRNYLSNIHMIIFFAAVTADVSPPLADDAAACMMNSLNRKTT